MTFTVIIIIAIIVFVAGAMIGSVSIGGIIIVPAITLITGMDIQTVVAATVFSFLFSGLVGGYLYGRRGLVNWRQAIWIGAGAMLGGYLGSLLLTNLPGSVVELIVGLVILVSGIYALWSKQEDPEGHPSTPPLFLALIGMGVGVGSAVSGAGGPVLLLPLLLWLKVPVLAAIAQGQVIQIPVALLSTAGNIQADNFDLQLGLLISVFVVTGTWWGARMSIRFNTTMLRKIVAGVLVLSALIVLGRLALNVTLAEEPQEITELSGNSGRAK